MIPQLLKTAGAIAAPILGIGAAILSPILGLLAGGTVGLTGGITVDITIFAIAVYINKK